MNKSGLGIFIKWFSAARECLIALTILLILSLYAVIFIKYKKDDTAVYYVEAYVCAVSIIICLLNLFSCLSVWVISKKNINYKLLITGLGFFPFFLLKVCVMLLDMMGYTLRG